MRERESEGERERERERSHGEGGIRLSHLARHVTGPDTHAQVMLKQLLHLGCAP